MVARASSVMAIEHRRSQPADAVHQARGAMRTQKLMAIASGACLVLRDGTLTAFLTTVQALMARTGGAHVEAPAPPGALDLHTAWAPLYHRVQASVRRASAAVVALGRIQPSGREASPALIGWLVTAANEGLGQLTRCATASMGDRQAPQNMLGRIINRENKQDDAVHAATVRARKLGLLPLATPGR